MLSRFAKRIVTLFSPGPARASQNGDLRSSREVVGTGSRRKARAAGRLAAGAAALLWPGAAFADCGGGRDLLAALAEENPQAYAAIVAAAAREPASEGVFWKIEAPGVAPSWLLGTYHFPHPLVDQTPPGAVAALDRSRVMLMEMSPEEMARLSTMIAQDPSLVANVDHPPLDRTLEPEAFAIVAGALEPLGMPADRVAVIRPWLLHLTLATPPCALAALAEGAPPMDAGFAALAEARGLEVKGMETWETLLPMLQDDEWSADSLDALVAAAEEAEQGRDIQTTLARLYVEQKVWRIWHFGVWKAERRGHAEGLAEAREQLFDQRNRAFVDAALPEIEAGGAFIVVGALHLGGAEGMAPLLRRRGFTVERAPLR